VTARETVELFHLAFVRALFQGLPDKTLVAVKDAINLRLYFESIRFSEDLDLDITTMSKEALENRVDRLLQSPLLLSPLKARGVLVKDISKPMQTDTVQTWKLGIATADASVDERTKIEFSRRDDVSAAEFAKIDPEVAAKYAMPPFAATHYGAEYAVRQKIHALDGRAETQPRDVFDLNVLFARPDAPAALDEETKAWLDGAIENTMRLTFEQYSAKVVAYLEPAQVEVYGTPEVWESMQLDVVTRLEALR
jgi:predicted nucleotidyltransferase component of viral defense system